MEFQYRDCTSRVYIFPSLTHTHPFLTRLTAICPQVQHEGLKIGSQTRGILAVSTCNISPTTQFLVELGVCCSEEDLREQQGLLEPAPPPADVFILALHSETESHPRPLPPSLSPALWLIGALHLSSSAVPSHTWVSCLAPPMSTSHSATYQKCKSGACHPSCP